MEASEKPPNHTPEYLLVMTCTISPAPSAGVARANPTLRLADYEHALRFWLSYAHPIANNILVLENSGADLAPLRALAARENPLHKKVEFLSISANIIPRGLNYGYAEMKMLDEGLARSQLRQTTTHLVKVTGRLTFPTCGRAIDLIAKTAPLYAPPLEAPPLDAMIDCRKLGFPRRGYDAATQICFFSHSFYDRILRNSREELNTTDNRLLEHLIYRKVSPFEDQPGVYLRFPCNVDPIGFSGFTGKSYNSPGTRFVQALRAVLRVLAPGYWF